MVIKKEPSKNKDGIYNRIMELLDQDIIIDLGNEDHEEILDGICKRIFERNIKLKPGLTRFFLLVFFLNLNNSIKITTKVLHYIMKYDILALLINQVNETMLERSKFSL